LATANLPASLTVNSLFPQSPRRTIFLPLGSTTLSSASLLSEARRAWLPMNAPAGASFVPFVLSEADNNPD